MTARTVDDRKGVWVPLWAMEDCNGDARDAMVLAQIAWFLQPRQRDGRRRREDAIVERDGHEWLAITDDELAGECGMSSDQTYRARGSLKKRGLITSQVRSVDGRKTTLIRPTLADVDQTATSRDGDDAEQIATSRPAKSRPRDQQTATSRNADRDSATTKSRERDQVVATSRNAPLSQPEEPKPEPSGAEAPRATDDPVVKRGHELTVLAFEQTPKPVLRHDGRGSAFAALLAIVVELLRADYADNDIAAAIRNGEVHSWTKAGLTVAIARTQRNNGRPTVEALRSAHERAAARDAEEAAAS